jgi:hypothetical protein
VRAAREASTAFVSNALRGFSAAGGGTNAAAPQRGQSMVLPCQRVGT